MHSNYFVVLAAAVSASACGDRPKEPEAASAPPAPVVSAVGYGFIRIGETARDLAVAGDSVAASNPKHVACRYAHPKAFPRGARVMLLDDVIVRIDVDSTGIRTAEGVQIGDPESRVFETYRGRVASLPHKYLKNGHNLVVWQPGITSRMIFETDGDKVLRYRVGRLPALDLVEGCG
jgi:hypothetical protein